MLQPYKTLITKHITAFYIICKTLPAKKAIATKRPLTAMVRQVHASQRDETETHLAFDAAQPKTEGVRQTRSWGQVWSSQSPKHFIQFPIAINWIQLVGSVRSSLWSYKYWIIFCKASYDSSLWGLVHQLIEPLVYRVNHQKNTSVNRLYLAKLNCQVARCRVFSVLISSQSSLRTVHLVKMQNTSRFAHPHPDLDDIHILLECELLVVIFTKASGGKSWEFDIFLLALDTATPLITLSPFFALNN